MNGEFNLVAAIIKEESGAYCVNITISGIEEPEEAIEIAQDIASFMAGEDICYDDPRISTMQ